MSASVYLRLPKRNSFRHRRRPGRARPEVWFRIVHIAQESADRASRSAYREQTVEIALGLKGAFKSGPVGKLARRLAPDRVVNALPARTRNRKPPKEHQTPRVVEHLRQAVEWKARLEAGDIQNQAAIAIQEGITRARVAQIMGLLRLAPGIQEQILSLPDSVGRPILTERALRPIAQIACPSDQRARFNALLQQSD